MLNSVGIALQVALDTPSPAERHAFVPHDMIEVPFDEIAAIWVDRSPLATRHHQPRPPPRARGAPAPDPDLTRQRTIVNAYFAAAREGGLEALVDADLDPGTAVRSARSRGLVNDAVSAVAFDGERPFAVLAFTVVDDHAVAIDVLNDPELVAKLDIRGITA